MLCLLALQPPGTRLWSLCQAAASAALMRVTRRCVAEHVPGTRACLLLPRTPTWQLPGSRATRCGACVLLYLRHQGLSSVWALTRKISRTIPRRNILTPQDVAAFDSLCALPQSSLFGFPGRSSADKYSRAQAAVSGKLMSALNRLALACACNAYWCPDHAHTTPHHTTPHHTTPHHTTPHHTTCHPLQTGAAYWWAAQPQEVPGLDYQRAVLSNGQTAYFTAVVLCKVMAQIELMGAALAPVSAWHAAVRGPPPSSRLPAHRPSRFSFPRLAACPSSSTGS